MQPAADPGPAPQQIRIASILIFVVVGLGVLATILLPTQRDYFLASMQRSLAAQQPQPTQLDVGLFVSVIIDTTMVIIFCVCAFWVLLGIKVRQGRNWARIVVTVFAGLTLVSTPMALVQLLGPVHAPLYSYASNLVSALIDIALLVLLWRQPAAGWIKACSAYRRQQRYLQR